MRVRKLGVLLALTTAATGLFSVQPAEAQTTVLVEICIIVGKISYNDPQQVYMPPVIPVVGTPYPGNTPTTYTFLGVNFACVGVNAGSGLCTAFSNGTTDPANPAAGEASSGFRGTYTSNCTIGGCSGNVGGPTNNMNPPSPGPGTAPWSYNNGPFVTGYIDCGTGLDITAGIIALVGAPDMTLPNFKVIAQTDANGDGIPDVTILYDCVIVAGVVVMVSVTL